MRTFKVSDEVYEQLKTFVVDPFDDTPDAVIGRLIEIVNKAKNRWSPFEPYDEAPPEEAVERPRKAHAARHEYQDDEQVVVL